jgi:UDP-2,3-diacylglucosamine pyrophosphatase LpxH
MSLSRRLSQVLKTSKEITINDESKLIIMSDCHRGNGSLSDNFFYNKLLFYAALRYYYDNNFTYIELGDGDELWENRRLSQIIDNHIDVFALMAKFYREKRFHMLFGNHDIVKRNKCIRECILREYFDEHKKKYITLFPHIDISEGIILRYKQTNDKILLIHGHQGDFFNDTIWKISRILVRYIWRPLELIGIHNPTSAAKNDIQKRAIEKNLIDWTIKNKQMIIAGHTHRPVFPKVGEHLYFNDGCCTHPRYITGIEITNGTISLVKWKIKTKKDRTLIIDKEFLSGPVKLDDYFNNK